MSRKGSKIFPKLDLEDIQSSPKLSRGNSASQIISQYDNSGEDDNISVSSNRSGNRRRKNSVGEEKAFNNTPSPRTPRSSNTQPLQVTLISSPSPRQPRLSRQHSYDHKTTNHSNQTLGSTPPLRRAKSGFDEDSLSISSNVTAKKGGRKSLRSGTNSISARGGKKRVSFKNPIIDPTPETTSSNYYSAAEPDPNDPDQALLEEELSKRRNRRRGRQDEIDAESGCGENPNPDDKQGAF